MTWIKDDGKWISVIDGEVVMAAGMYGTMHVHNDRYPVHIIEVLSQKRVRVAALRVKVTTRPQGCYDETEGEYIFEPVPDDPGYIVTLRKNGRWVRQGDSLRGLPYTFGRASLYRDPCS